MIDRQDILEFAREVGLDANVVEKDYVLGWMLAGTLQGRAVADVAVVLDAVVSAAGQWT